MDQAPSIHTKNTKVKILILILVVFGFITTFITGFVLARLLASEVIGTTTSAVPGKTDIAIPVTDDDNSPTVPQDSTKFIPGKHYFDDTIILVSKKDPSINLVATVTRSEQDGSYTQGTRISFFDGTSWDRKISSQKTENSSIVSNGIVKSWNVTIDPTRVLKQTVDGEVIVNKKAIQFTSGTLQNEISVRSLPGYTKFMSEGTGTITVEGTSYDAYVLYTRIYSLNASDIQFYSEPLGLTTDWMIFWDTAGNFYHADVTNVQKPTDIYQTHELGIMKNSQGSVSKTFNVSVTRDGSTPPKDYAISFGEPLGTKLNFQRINQLNKAPDGSFDWFIGNIDGKIEKNGQFIPGKGLIEYIHN